MEASFGNLISDDYVDPTAHAINTTGGFLY